MVKRHGMFNTNLCGDAGFGRRFIRIIIIRNTLHFHLCRWMETHRSTTAAGRISITVEEPKPLQHQRPLLLTTQ